MMEVKRWGYVPTDGYYCVGDVLPFTLNDGEQVEALAVKQEQDGMVFVLVDCLHKEYPMNRTNTNKGGYEKSLLRKKLNTEILDRFPAEIREKMVAFPNGDLLRLPTEREIFGENIFDAEEDESVEQWSPMKERKNRIAFQGKGTDRWEWYWLQNEYDGSAADFAIVSGSGYAYYNTASAAAGVRPAFKI